MDRYRVRPGTHVRLDRFDPAHTGKHADEDAARATLARDIDRLRRLQDVLYASRRHALLIVLQGMDTAGKDGTIKHVMSGVNPTGCEVVAFKVPTEDEAAHDFLWRVHRATPRRGHITIFNRSHYEDVIVPRVHRTLPRAVVKARYEQINAFEQLLVESGTVVLKFFLHVSREEQRERLLERLADPSKTWKFSENDLKERALWDDYTRAYEKLLTRCSTDHAPWWVIPADRKWYRNLVVARIIVDALKALRLAYPPAALSPARLARLRRTVAREA
jgi:PPK2 family polyphosphate:nucleotide phosphotransferase